MTMAKVGIKTDEPMTIELKHGKRLTLYFLDGGEVKVKLTKNDAPICMDVNYRQEPGKRYSITADEDGIKIS